MISDEYTSQNGFTGKMYGESSFAIFDKNGKMVFHTGFRTFDSYSAMVTVVENYPKLLKALEKFDITDDFDDEEDDI